MATRRQGMRGEDCEEWRSNAVSARERRAIVGERVGRQVRDLVVDGDMGSGRAPVADRIRAVAAADRRGDRALLRSEVMALAAAAGAWAAQLDLDMPRDERLDLHE